MKTTPHGITYPEGDDEFQPAEDMAVLVDGIESALDELDDAGLPGVAFEPVEAQLSHDGTAVALTDASTAKVRPHGPITQYTALLIVADAVPAGGTLLVTPPTASAFPVTFFLAHAAKTTAAGDSSVQLVPQPAATGFSIANPGLAAGEALHLTVEYEAADA
ncbi:MAG: hypothetical protein ACRD0P_14255 [Stackebrandtia sp.]